MIRSRDEKKEIDHTFVYLVCLRAIITAGEQIPNAKVITLDRCKEVLKQNGLTLEENTLKELREYLYFLAGLQLEDERAKEDLAVCAG